MEFKQPTAKFGTALHVRQMAQAHAEYYDRVTLSEGTLNAIENSAADAINAAVSSYERKQRDVMRG